MLLLLLLVVQSLLLLFNGCYCCAKPDVAVQSMLKLGKAC
jgi:hypothetical protein